VGVRLFTNRAAGVRGGTIPVTVRLPANVVEFMDAHLDENLRTRSDWLQHSVALYSILVEREEQRNPLGDT
jgi:hypothetical protein